MCKFIFPLSLSVCVLYIYFLISPPFAGVAVKFSLYASLSLCHLFECALSFSVFFPIVMTDIRVRVSPVRAWKANGRHHFRYTQQSLCTCIRTAEQNKCFAESINTVDKSCLDSFSTQTPSLFIYLTWTEYYVTVSCGNFGSLQFFVKYYNSLWERLWCDIPNW